MILQIILVVIASYFFLMFVVSRLVIPNLGFFRPRIPKKLPTSMENAIKQVSKKSKSNKEFIINSYHFLAKRYRGGHAETFTNFSMLFMSIPQIWKKKGFIHCTFHAFLLRIFLIRSGRFKENEIKIKHSASGGFCIHQYLSIKMDKKWVNVDLWGAKLGIPFGKYASVLN